MTRIWRFLVTVHVICHYRLLSLLPPRPGRGLLVALQTLWPGSWLGPRRLSEGERLRQALERLGPIYIKMGQLLATRRDLLPPEWTQALSLLQDRVTPFDAALARQRIETELGRPVEQVFLRFDAEPLASGSIAQVHAAVLQDGSEVVIKIRRPNLLRALHDDLAIMQGFARWLEALWQDARYFRPSRVVEDYRRIILGELDLAAEARNHETMRRHFLFSPLLYMPPIHMEYTTPRMLVMERIHGIPVNDIAAIRAAGIDPRRLAERGVEIFFTQVFRHNLFHADMHPGNIFVNPAHPESPQYMAVDAAIAGSLSRGDLHLLGRMLLAVMRRDYGELVDLVIRAGWSSAPIDAHLFENTVRGLLEPLVSQPLDKLELAPLVMKLFDTARSFRIEMPVQYILLMKTIVHIEGLGRSIYPQLDIWSTGRPLLEAYLMEEYGPMATLRKLQDRAPEWLARMPEMPDLLRNALENLSHLPHHYRTLESRHAEQLARHRRKMLGGLTSLALLGSSLLLSGIAAALAVAAGALGLAWALRR